MVGPLVEGAQLQDRNDSTARYKYLFIGAMFLFSYASGDRAQT